MGQPTSTHADELGRVRSQGKAVPRTCFITSSCLQPLEHVGGWFFGGESFTAWPENLQAAPLVDQTGFYRDDLVPILRKSKQYSGTVIEGFS